MATLNAELRQLVELGPLAHLSTINQDGSPQVAVVWIGIDGDDLVTAHMGNQLKLRNMQRDPRVAISLEAPREPGVFLAHYATIKATASIEGPTEEAWELLNRLTKVYMDPHADFPAPRAAGSLVRYTIEKIGGVGPWAG
jgi:PPOX class probable F420-dependent enzyme